MCLVSIIYFYDFFLISLLFNVQYLKYITYFNFLSALKITTCFMLGLLKCFKSVTSTICFNHVHISNQCIKLFKVYLIIFLLFVCFLKTLNFINTKKSMINLFSFFMITLLCATIWTILTLISFIFIVDTINILIYIIIFDRDYFSNLYVKTVEFFIGISIFFWVSFFSTVVFFLVIFSFYTALFTGNFNMIFLMSVYNTTLITLSFKIKIFFALTLLFVFFFLKCGMVPLFYWKGSFLKCMSTVTLIYYTIVYFSTILLFFTHMLLNTLYILFFITKLLSYIIFFIGILILGYTILNINDICSIIVFSSILNGILVLFVSGVVINLHGLLI
jgi:hypothetical protein